MDSFAELCVAGFAHVANSFINEKDRLEENGILVNSRPDLLFKLSSLKEAGG